jgi:hypothetical protein
MAESLDHKDWVGPQTHHQTTLLQARFSQQSKQTYRNLYFIYLVAKKVFVGPHFCITKLCLNKVMEIGVLHLTPDPNSPHARAHFPHRLPHALEPQRPLRSSPINPRTLLTRLSFFPHRDPQGWPNSPLEPIDAAMKFHPFRRSRGTPCLLSGLWLSCTPADVLSWSNPKENELTDTTRRSRRREPLRPSLCDAIGHRQPPRPHPRAWCDLLHLVHAFVSLWKPPGARHRQPWATDLP